MIGSSRLLLYTGVLLGILCCISEVGARCPCNGGWKSTFCLRCYGPCPLNAYPISDFEALSKKELFGQADAASMLSNALRTRNGERPLALHLVGPNGVGKSHTAKLVGKAFFETIDKQTKLGAGVLWISGKDYRFRTSKQEIYDTREEIRQLVINHLWKCPNGIIVIDEAEVVRHEILGILEDFLGDSHPFVESRDHKLKVATKEAIFLLVSDFGKEKVSMGVSRKEMVDFVNAETVAILRNPRLVQLLHSVIPFMPLPKVNCTQRTGDVDQAVLDYINYLIAQLKTHPVVKDRELTVSTITGDFKGVADEALHRVVSSDLCWRNYRGIYQVFDELVTGPFVRKLSPFQKQVVRVSLYTPLSMGVEVIPVYPPGGKAEL